ncbi:ATP-binding protein [Kitasatospora sp. NPDC001261]|uniref:ATP-binding protein n=1 Tax=Kitasatospora sp. NPDC001261 TaxID=3364012 RepID=UPI0036CB8284
MTTSPDQPWLLPEPEPGALPDRSEVEELRSVELRADRAAASAGRRLVRTELLGWGLADLADDVVLVASELITNAVVHGRGPGADKGFVTVTIARYRRMVALCVEDQNLTFPVSRVAGADATGGRGLELVGKLSDHVTLGRTEAGGGKRITAYWRSDGTAKCLQSATEPALAT